MMMDLGRALREDGYYLEKPFVMIRIDCIVKERDVWTIFVEGLTEGSFGYSSIPYEVVEGEGKVVPGFIHDAVVSMEYGTWASREVGLSKTIYTYDNDGEEVLGAMVVLHPPNLKMLGRATKSAIRKGE